MKKLSFLLVISFFLNFFNLNAQIQKDYCSNFKNYHQIRDDTNNLKVKKFLNYPIEAYGDTKGEAKINAKIQALNQILYNQMYLDNPLVDSIVSEFSGEAVFLISRKYDIAKTRPWKDRKILGKYTCFVYEIEYNPELVDFLKKHIDNFIKMQGTFIINPYIIKDGDVGTKNLYNNAKNNFHTAINKSRYKLDGLKDLRLLEFAELPDKPTDYNPCEGFKYYKTDNKYLNYINAITNNANRQINIDFIFSVDTISIIEIPNSSKKITNFHLMAFNVHNATEILVYDSKDTCQGTDYECVENSMNHVFERDKDIIMYELIKRYSNYIRDGVEFSLLICDSLLNDEISITLEESFIDCSLFADGSIRPGEWTNNGVDIGDTYNGRTYMLDPLKFKTRIYRLLQQAGLENFNIDVSGMSYVITPK